MEENRTEAQSTAVQSTVPNAAVQKETGEKSASTKKSFTGKREKNSLGRPKVKIGKVIGWVIALIVFLVITNPSIIPFLSEDTKDSLKDTWSRVFGDVGKISKVVKFNWATLFQVIAIILLTLVVTSLILFVLDHIKPRTPKSRSAVTLFRSATGYIAVLVGFFWCLSALGVNVSTIFASVGVVALIVGFGAQSLVEDLVTGIFLVFEDQFNVGDIIEVNGFRGTVDAIGIRTTAIRDTGNNVKLINNSDLRNILNRSTANSKAVTSVSVAYEADLEKVEEEIAKFLPAIKAKYPNIFLEIPQYIGVDELADSGVILKFVATVSEQNIFSGARLLNREIKIAFDKAGIEIPYNQIVLHNAKE